MNQGLLPSLRVQDGIGRQLSVVLSNNAHLLLRGGEGPTPCAVSFLLASVSHL